MPTVPSDVAELIEGKPLVANIATSANDRPHVTPIWYLYDDETLYFTTNGPKKVENIRENPNVAVAIQNDIDGHPQWMVAFRGTGTVHDDTETITDITRRIYEVYVGSDPDAWDERRQQQVRDPNPTRRVIEVDIGSVFKKTYGDDEGLKKE